MSKLRVGIFITTILSILSLPLTYISNWILSQFGEIVVADYAILLMISSIVSTFFLFGASTIYSMYLPKIENDKTKINFIISTSLVSIFLLIIGIILIVSFPEFSFSIISEDSNTKNSIFAIVLFVFIFGIGQIVSYSLVGLHEYKIAAYLNFTQPFIIFLFLLLFYFFNRQFIIENSFSILIFLVICIWAVNILVGLVKIFYTKDFKYSWFLPKGFWTQALYVHLGTILTFLYGYVDQILVLSYLGKKELAIYFLTIQIARLVNFITLKLLQVFQSSFAETLKSSTFDGMTHLKRLYDKIARYNLFISASIAVFLILFGDEVMSFFSQVMSFNSNYLFLLVLTFFIGSLGSIHSQIVQATENNRIYFINNVIIVIIQIGLSLYLVKDYGVLGIIYSRLFTTVIGQLGLMYILKRKCNIDSFSPLKYLGLILLLLLIYFLVADFSILLKSVFFVLIIAFLLKFLQINIKKYGNFTSA